MWRWTLAFLPLVLLTGCGKPAPEELFQDAVQLMRQGNFVSARHRLQELVETYPDYELVPDARMGIGDCFNQEGRTDDARAVYEKVVREYPETPYSWMGHIRLGDMAAVEEKWDEAEKEYNAAIADASGTPQKIRAMKNLAEMYVRADKIDQAVETYRKMQEIAERPAEKVQLAQILTNLYFNQDRPEDAWAAITEVYDASLTYGLLNQYYLSVMQTAGSLKEFQRGFNFFDEHINDTTDEERQALALYYKARLAASTTPYRATGVAWLKEVHEKYPETEMGRWAEADAAVVISNASNEFPDSATRVKTLFDDVLNNYDDIINDITTEWWYPQKSIHAWRQVARLYKIRGLFLENVDDLKAASKTHVEIVNKFKDNPELRRVVQDSYREVGLLTQWVQIAEASPEMFWSQARRFRAGKPIVRDSTPETENPEEAGDPSADSEETQGASEKNSLENSKPEEKNQGESPPKGSP